MSATDTSPLWGPQRSEWLQVLGHPPLMLVDRQAVVSAEPPAPQPRDAAQVAPAPAPALAAIAPTTDGLQRALLRATGLPAAEADRALQSLGVDAAALRGDPAAKRQLWSRLRRMRGGRSR